MGCQREEEQKHQNVRIFFLSGTILAHRITHGPKNKVSVTLRCKKKIEMIVFKDNFPSNPRTKGSINIVHYIFCESPTSTPFLLEYPPPRSPCEIKVIKTNCVFQNLSGDEKYESVIFLKIDVDEVGVSSIPNTLNSVQGSAHV